jgi:glyoxylate reductase
MSSVLVTRRIPSSALALLREHAEVDLADEGLDAAALRERVRGKSGVVCLLTDRVNDEVLAAGVPSLKIVANIAVGYDNLDVAAARSRGVIVTNTPDVLTGATAELTWALILDVTRRISEGDRLIRRGDWKGWALDFMLGTELAGKQLGIVGDGRIGRAVAAKADAFGMRVVVARRKRARSDEAEPRPHASDGASAGVGDSITLDELLSTSDVVSLHVPLTSDTRHLIDRTALARMKRTAYLVNTSRGSVVDEPALVWALQERLIAGAALDVFEQEPSVHPGSLSFANVLLVPHLGSATRETRTAMAELAVRNVVAVLAGEPPLTPVGNIRN